METLSQELLLNIFGFLEPKELILKQSISRKYYGILRDARFWKTHCFNSSFRQQVRQHLTPIPQPEDKRMALTNWTPSYPEENLDFLEEYRHRHAPVTRTWIHNSKQSDQSEITGISHLPASQPNSDELDKLFASHDDGSIEVWSLKRELHSTFSRLVRSPAVLPANLTIVDPPAEGITLSPELSKGYFAVGDTLHEISLDALQPVSALTFPSRIAAIAQSPQSYQCRIIATEQQVHVVDSRSPHSTSNPISSLLPDPNPRTLCPIPGTPALWVGGRFSHLLAYDLRAFPQGLRSLHACNPVSSLSLLDKRFFDRGGSASTRSVDALLPNKNIEAAKKVPGYTLIAGGHSRGRAALHLHALQESGDAVDLPPAPNPPPSSTAAAASSFGPSLRNNHLPGPAAANAASILAAAPHGGKVVVADSAGLVRWVERDGRTPVRAFDLDDVHGRAWDAMGLARGCPGWEGAAGREGERRKMDVVRKLVPVEGKGGGLVVWTDGGEVAMVGFGRGWVADGDGFEQGEAAVEDGGVDSEEGTLRRAVRSALNWHMREMNFFRRLFGD